ncbi:MAG TPA: DUF3870 domain-containing protein [Paenibacillaceae bacterium]
MQTVLVTGYSKAPQGTSMHEMYKYTGIVMEIHKETDVILDVEFTFVTDLAKNYLKRLLMGYDMKNGIEPLIERIKEHYLAPSQQSVIVALKVAYQRYRDSKSSMDKGKKTQENQPAEAHDPEKALAGSET